MGRENLEVAYSLGPRLTVDQPLTAWGRCFALNAHRMPSGPPGKPPSCPPYSTGTTGTVRLQHESRTVRKADGSDMRRVMSL